MKENQMMQLMTAYGELTQAFLYPHIDRVTEYFIFLKSLCRLKHKNAILAISGLR